MIFTKSDDNRFIIDGEIMRYWLNVAQGIQGIDQMRFSYEGLNLTALKYFI